MAMFNIWLLTTLMVSSVITQENTTIVIDNITQPIPTTTEYVLPINLSSIFTFRFDLKEDSINDVVAEIIFNNATKVNITVEDLLQLTEAEQLNLTTVNEILDQLDLSSPELFNFDSLQSAFSELNISALNIYRKLNENFIPNPRDVIPRLLDTFGIDQRGFNDVILYGNDADLFQILKSGNFTEQNIKTAFDIIEKSPSDLYEFIKPTVFPNIKIYPIERLLDVVKKNGITIKHFKDVLDIFDLSRAKYYAIPSFRNVLTDYIDQINSVEVYGTVSNVNEIATVKLIKNRYEYFNNIAQLYIENFILPRTTYKVVEINNYSDDCANGPVIVKFEGSNAGRVVEITQNYPEHHIHDCSYITVANGALIIEKFHHVHYKQKNLIADVSNNTIFKTGSPLICNDELYGIAEDKSIDKIGFRSFQCDGSLTDTTTIFSDNASNVLKVAVAIKTFILLALIQTLIM